MIIEAFPSLRFDACLHYRGTYVLHLNLSALQRLVLLLEVSTPQGSELHLNVSALQRPVLLLEVSTPQGPKLIWTCLHYRRKHHYRSFCLLSFELLNFSALFLKLLKCATARTSHAKVIVKNRHEY